MKKKSLFLLAPLAMAALASCGGSTSWSKTTYEDAVKIAETFSKNLGDYNKKASRSTISGTINKLDFHGKLRYKEGETDIDADNASIKMNNANIADVSIDLNSLRSLIEGGDTMMYISYFTAFPTSKHFVKFTKGIESLPLAYYYDKKFSWDSVNQLDWTNIETTFYKAGSGDKSKLRIDLKANDFVAAADEVSVKLGGKNIGEFSETTKFSAYISFTTNEWGYVDTLSAKIEAPTIEYEDTNAYPDIFKVDGSFYFSANFKFNYEFVETRNIQFQVGEYNDEGKIVVSEVGDLTDFSKYFTGDWFNYNNPDPSDRPTSIDTYDDPIFNLYYWIKRSRSIAYTGESYALNIIPTYEPITSTQPDWKPKYEFMFEECSVMVDGRKVDDGDNIFFEDIDYYDYPVDIGEPNPKLVDITDIGKLYINADTITSLAKDSKVVIYLVLREIGA